MNSIYNPRNVQVFYMQGFSNTSLSFYKEEERIPQVNSSVSLSLEGDGWGNALIRSFRTFDIWHRHQHSSFLNEEYGFYSQMAQKTIGKNTLSKRKRSYVINC